MAEMTVSEWLQAIPKNDLRKETDWPYEARRSACVYGASAAILACNYGVSADEVKALMAAAFQHELDRRRSLEITYLP